MNGNRVLYRMEQAYSMFDMNVTGEVLRTTSMTYNITVGNVDANDSVMIEPTRVTVIDVSLI